MKIAFACMFYKPTIGGVEKVIEILAQDYVRKGHKVDVYCSDSDKYKRLKKKFEILYGVKVYRSRYIAKLSLNTYIFPGIIWDLLWKKYDVVHSHVGAHDFVLYSGIIAKLKGVPHIHTTHCPWTDKFRPLAVRIPLFFTDLFLNHISFNLCDKIIAITPWELPILKKSVRRNKIKVLPNGMEKNLFKKVKNNTFRKKFMKNPKNKLVLFFGRLHPTKAPHHLAIVAQEILKEKKDIEFIFVGPDEGMMKKVKEVANNHPKIHIIGPWPYEKIGEMYQAADLYVLPSYREGLPLTLFEAMASGLPIVATAVNGVPYEIQSDVNGYLIPYGSKRSLKKSILKVLDNPKLAKKFSKTNREKVKNYTWEHIAEETLNIYKQEIMKKRR